LSTTIVTAVPVLVRLGTQNPSSKMLITVLVVVLLFFQILSIYISIKGISGIKTTEANGQSYAGVGHVLP
jgi:hypothetical protein